MSRNKKEREELLNTHVINIKEIREAEKKEKHIINMKKSLKYCICGIFLIIIGCSYTTLINYINLNKKSDLVVKKVTTNNTNNNTLNCISNIDDKEKGIKVWTKSTFNFINNQVNDSIINSKITLLNNTNTNILNDIKNKYSEMYITNNYVNYYFNVVNNELVINEKISSYKNFIVENYNNELDNLLHIYLLKGYETKSEVKQKLESIGSLCK